MKASKVFEQVRVILSEYSEDGVVIPDSDVSDIQAKFLKLVNMGQRELFNIGGMEKIFEFSHVPVKNLLNNGFETMEYIGEVQYFPNEEGISGVKCYSFEVDGESHVEIQENQSGTWVTISDNVVPSTVLTYTSFKNSISTTGNVRIKFSGNYYYKHQNRALFSQPFSAARIPSYRPYTKIQLPADFGSVDKVVKEFALNQYKEFSDYKIENRNNFYIDWEFEGNIRIIYNPIPIEITALTDDLQVDDIQSDALVYFCVAKIATDGYKDLVNYAEQLYNEKIAKLSRPEPSTFQQIEDVYGGFEVI